MLFNKASRTKKNKNLEIPIDKNAGIAVLSAHYNKNYNIPECYSPPWGIEIEYPRKGMETINFLSHFIQRGELTNCLEALEHKGFTEERAILMLTAAQLAGGAS